MKNITIMVTGGAGFIGSNFIHYLFERYENIKVINYDKLTYAGNLQNLKTVENKPGYLFEKGDICDKKELKAVFEKYSPDHVVNFAAESHVDKSILNPETFVNTNVLGTQNLLTLSMSYDVKRYLQISTDEVYGSLGETGYFTEDTSLAPNSPYSASKASADLLTMAYNHTYGFPALITRCSNNYGAYQFPEKLIPLIILNVLKGKQIPVYGDGLNIRDWLCVKDHCSAIDTVLQKGKIGEVYNIGGNNEKTNIEIVKTILDILSKKFPEKGISDSLISFVKDRKGHDRRYAIDASKIKRELNWEPKVSFEEGIKTTVDWYFNNMDWLDAVINEEYLNYYSKVYVDA
jgi:dTDP-glucose 4,6-dehydratase